MVRKGGLMSSRHQQVTEVVPLKFTTVMTSTVEGLPKVF